MLTPMHRLFYSFAPADRQHGDALAKHLIGLRAAGLIDDWGQHELLAGDEADEVMAKELAAADLAVVLLSADFLADKGCCRVLAQAQQLAAGQRLRLIPILVRAVDRGPSQLADLSPLPTNGIPVTSWAQQDEAWTAVVRGIRQVVEGRQPAPAGTPVRPLPSNLPYIRNSEFVGRKEELATIHRYLFPAPRSGPIALVGLGGIGKTQLALEYAYTYQANYERVLWVDAEGEDIAPSFAALAGVLDVPAPAGSETRRLAQRVRMELERGGPHLLILDNISSPASYPPHLPKLGNVRVLITTRRSDLAGVTGFRMVTSPAAV